MTTPVAHPRSPRVGAPRSRAGWLVRARAWAVLVAAALLPFETLAAAPVGPLRVTLLEAALLAAAALQVAASLQQPRVRPGWRSPEAWLVAFLASAAASAALAPDGGAWRGALRLGLGGVYALAVARTCAQPPPGWRLDRLAAVVVAVAAVSAALGLAGHHRPSWLALESLLQLFRPKATLAAGARRLTATFQHANLAGAFFATALPLAVALARRAPVAVSRAALAWAGVALVLGALVATGSRGALVAGVVAAAAVAALGGGERRVTLGSLARTWAVGLALLALALAADPAARHRLGLPPTGPGYGARLVVPAQLAPGARQTGGTAAVTLHNTGWLTWRPVGTDPVRLVADAVDDQGAVVATRRTALPAAVPGGSSVTLRAAHPPGARVRWRLEQHGWAPLPGVAWSGLPVAPSAAVSIARRPQATAARRADLWPLAIALWRERPYLGHGPDTFRRQWPARAPALRPDPRMHANQLGLELLADVGLLGALAFVALCVVALGPWLGRAPEWLGRAPERLEPAGGRALSAAFAWAAVAWLLHGLVDCVLYFNGPAAVFWLALGVAMHPRGAGELERGSPGGRSGRAPLGGNGAER